MCLTRHTTKDKPKATRPGSELAKSIILVLRTWVYIILHSKVRRRSPNGHSLDCMLREGCADGPAVSGDRRECVHDSA